MIIDKIEYIILLSCIKEPESLQNIASDWRLSHAEVAIAAKHLFENSDIMVIKFTEVGEYTDGIVFTMSQIKAHLNGKLPGACYLTAQGATKWESLSHPNWNQYYKWRSEINGKSEIICVDRQLIEKLLSVSYINSQVVIPSTEIWEEIEHWQATYWKTLPKAYRVRYQYKPCKDYIDSSASQERIEADKEAKRWYFENLKWYTDPNLESAPPNPIDYAEFNDQELPNQIFLQKTEYLILDFAVIFNTCSLGSVAYSKHISHLGIALAADNLFQKGYILARVFADEYDHEGTPNVTLTLAEIQDHLDERIIASYYLTAQGGAAWEAMAHPDWNKFFIVNFGMYPYEEGILGTEREVIEKILAVDQFILIRPHLPGTEVWQVFEPWHATYWKTLPRGYHVSYRYNSEHSIDWYSDENIPAELMASYEQANQWYENMRKWYTNPFCD